MTDYLLIKDPLSLDKKEWIKFIQSNPNGNIFHSPEMFELHNNNKKYECIFISFVDSGGKMQGLLIAFVFKEYKGFAGELTARAIVSGGPLIINNKTEVADLLLTEFDKIGNRKAVYSQFRNLWDISCYKSVFNKEDYEYEDHLNFLFDLRRGEEYLWNNIHPTRKKQINRSIKRGVKTCIVDKLTENELGSCFSILKQVYKAAKLPHPDLVYFLKAFQVLGNNGYLKTILATLRDEIIGFRFFLGYNGILYDWYAGSLPEHHDKYPNDILPWELMKWGITNGFNTFDFGGAGKPGVPYGVRDYKMKFGGELVNFGRYEKVNKPFTMVLAKLGFRIWKLLK
jgi:lipid II:glycine glycyltransferase (peptidoglycan interpeptide bridge formation enzyme)